nr:hypothetical protein [uncultured Blautia sp.]
MITYLQLSYLAHDHHVHPGISKYETPCKAHPNVPSDFGHYIRK